ncbi:MAG: hypothetical protein L3J28_03965 [Candidatus Polarisedimenticolaceae bacterium]|nr:hypothetical protein [Candidatus Polarisedimenticolaceae bacterium]
MPKMSKRMGPVPVEPVTIDGLRIEVVHWGSVLGVEQNGGYLHAINVTSEESAWTLQVYKIEYDPNKEMDVQDVFITSLSLTEGGLEVTDELDRHYLVDLQNKEVTQLTP